MVLSEVHVYLVFWGSAWSAAPTPTIADVTNAVETLLASPHTSGLAQYGNIGQGRLGGRVVVTSSDPPNPFRDADIVGLLHRLIESGDLVEPEDDRQALYVVMLPPGVGFVKPGVVGEHSFFMYLDLTDPRLPPDFEVANAHYGWVSNDGTLDSVTTVFSHELVEACTDPEGTAIQGLPGTCARDGWCEIGDVCSTTGVVDGVLPSSRPRVGRPRFGRRRPVESPPRRPRLQRRRPMDRPQTDRRPPPRRHWSQAKRPYLRLQRISRPAPFSNRQAMSVRRQPCSRRWHRRSRRSPRSERFFALRPISPAPGEESRRR
jgi:hypothetical protein